MPVVKWSLFGQGGEPEKTVEVDESLARQFQETVDAQPDLTFEEAFRQGIQHIVDKGPLGGSGSGQQ